MNNLLQKLLRLQTLEFGESDEKEPTAEITELRSKIPQQILGHYDRLRARDKKGMAAVRNQVCSACHMQVPIGVVATIMHGTDIQLCGSCGRYLYLPKPEPAETEAAPAMKPAKPAPKKRKRRAPVHAA